MSRLLTRCLFPMLLLLTLAAIHSLPVTVLAPDALADHWRPLAGASIGEGRAMAVASDGSVQGTLQWRWCPTQGLASMCVNLSRAGIWVEAVYKPLTGGRLDVETLSVTPSAMKNRDARLMAGLEPLSATLHGFSVRADAACPVQGLLAARGEFYIRAHGAVSEEKISWLPQEDGSVLLQGASVSGRLQRQGEVLTLDAQLRISRESEADHIRVQLTCGSQLFNNWI